jgi:hypothetical protein
MPDRGSAPRFEVRPGDIALYFDGRFPLAPGNQTNQVAVIVDEDGALCIGKGVIGRRVERISLGTYVPDPTHARSYGDVHEMLERFKT